MSWDAQTPIVAYLDKQFGKNDEVNNTDLIDPKLTVSEALYMQIHATRLQ